MEGPLTTPVRNLFSRQVKNTHLLPAAKRSNPYFIGIKLYHSSAKKTSYGNALLLYVKITCILFLLCILFFLFYIGQGIILPLGFFLLIAVPLFPLEQKMTILACPCGGILVALLIAAIVLVALIMFLLPGLFFRRRPSCCQKNLAGFILKIQDWIDDTFHVSKQQQNQVITDAKMMVWAMQKRWRYHP